MLQVEFDDEDGLIDERERQVREDALLERLAMSQGSNAQPAGETVDG